MYIPSALTFDTIKLLIIFLSRKSKSYADKDTTPFRYISGISPY